jgi:hypothetical protein
MRPELRPGEDPLADRGRSARRHATARELGRHFPDDRSTVVLVRSAQIDTVDSPVLGGAATDRQWPVGPGRPGRAGGWRPGPAQGQAGQLDVTMAAPADGHRPAQPAISGRDLKTTRRWTSVNCGGHGFPVRSWCTLGRTCCPRSARRLVATRFS